MSKKTRLSELFLKEFSPLNPKTSESELISFVIDSQPYINFISSWGYKFKDNNLFIQSLAHSSFSHELSSLKLSNEKLEFLGDSVLQLLVSEKLYSLYPNEKEGDLSKLRSAIVNEDTLYELSLFSKLDELILLGVGEFKEEGYFKKAILSDLFEAILGAIYLDSGIDKAREVFFNLVSSFEGKTNKSLFSLENLVNFDSKSRLQEICLKKFKVLPLYETCEEKDHGQIIFNITLRIKDEVICSIKDSSKKKGIQKLAKMALSHEFLQG